MYLNLVWGIIGLVVSIGLIFSNIGRGKNQAGYLILAISLVLILTSFIRIVPAGTVGIVDLFGKVSQEERQSGLNFINPFAKLEIMNIKTEEIKEVMTVPSKEGLSIDVDVSALYRMVPEKASEIYRTIGLGYRQLVITPQFRSATRGVTVNYEAKGLYTSGREEISQRIFEELSQMLEDRGVVLEKVLLRSIRLPNTVAHAIEMKLKAEQEAEQMRFVLDKEKKESERKIIEAEGIAKAQEIINTTLTQAYLQHEAIQAQMKMADSPNHTTVYIPVGTNGIPLIKDIKN